MDEGVVVVREGATLAAAAAEWLADQVRVSIEWRGRCALMLSGGRALRPVYAALATDPLAGTIDWPLVHIYFADERAVPPDDAESNYRMIAEVLLARVPVPASQIHRMEAERPDIVAAASDYERLLPDQLDVLCLGIGPDGHTASLFPGHAELTEQRRRVVSILSSPKPPARRVTITPPVIAAARRIAMLATGAEKAAMVQRALEGPLAPRDVPAQLARRGTWFLDAAAAAGLRRPAGAGA